MVQLSATRRSCIAILFVSLVSFAAITLCVASQPVFVFLLYISLSTQSGNFWIYLRMPLYCRKSVLANAFCVRNAKLMFVLKIN
jgi:hypothetical protein